jgi:hypothetical protein
VLTVGVDLAAEPANTAVARIRWTQSSALVEAVGVGADDPALAEQIMASDKAGIDCPLGGPRRFVEFVVAHQAGALDVRGYKGAANTAVRQLLVDALPAAAPWLSLGHHDRPAGGPTTFWTRSSPR